MDGLEWKRTKYPPAIQRFLHYSEKLAIKYSDFFVADSIYIQTYLKEKYQVNPTYIAYGATVFNMPDATLLLNYDLHSKGYNMLMARMEPENNIEMILDGYHLSQSPRDFIVIGNTNNKFGSYLIKKFSADKGYVSLVLYITNNTLITSYTSPIFIFMGTPLGALILLYWKPWAARHSLWHRTMFLTKLF
ncbi:DUF1972 domain-containing protein [Paraflavitalea speifideaquila]|uniref:DUF1972 domain-containing protein n=1 Tax=Paraflavitalea speifideaquila TaxID=3076558 RepID=UPI0028E77DA5|nr:DUF1972 domain-containing protein [Paraflavitalea speifideiaquila]